MATSDERVVQVYADASEAVHCMKCQRALHSKDIAMLIRTAPSDAFNAWCPECTRFILMHAANDLDVESFASIIVTL